MLTVMCPNCQHRFPAPGCCNLAMQQDESNRLMAPQSGNCADFYGGLLVPRGFTGGNGCFINAPTIVNGPAIIQTGEQGSLTNPVIKMGQSNVDSYKNPSHGSMIVGETSSLAKYTHSASSHVKLSRTDDGFSPMDDSGFLPTTCRITTTCDLTGGSVTITTPRIQSGGCLIQCSDSGILFQAPIEIKPRLTGEGCIVQKRIATEARKDSPTFDDDSMLGIACSDCQDRVFVPPSGCQELPGTRRVTSGEKNFAGCSKNCYNSRFTTCWSSQFASHAYPKTCTEPDFRNCAASSTDGRNNQKNCSCAKQSPTQSQAVTSNLSSAIPPSLNQDGSSDSSGGLQIQVNATVQLPASLGQCTVNITATTNSVNTTGNTSTVRCRNNFNGGGLVQPPDGNLGFTNASLERTDGTPSTPVSWLMPCPWNFDGLVDKDVTRLCEVKRLLHICGWYHEDLSWQQSENLLKEAPVGCWLMRDSSDSRYTFAVSVQTARGPTSVRVHYFLGGFRLDAAPRLAMAMPIFDCPIKMLEYYVEYSKRINEQKKEVWVDYSGQIYSQIYLTTPLVKEVRSLSHLARLAVNRSKLPTSHLPHLIRRYLADYPYTL